MVIGLAAVLEAALARQHDAQRSFYHIRPEDMTTQARMENMRTNALAAVAEIIEVIDETGWKPWKSNGFGTVNHAAFADEMADVLLFLFNMAIGAGVSGTDLARALEDAWQKNETRQRDGY